jgi:hypothetical protein
MSTVVDNWFGLRVKMTMVNVKPHFRLLLAEHGQRNSPLLAERATRNVNFCVLAHDFDNLAVHPDSSLGVDKRNLVAVAE